MKTIKNRKPVSSLKAGKSFVLMGEFYTVMAADGGGGPKIGNGGGIISYGHRDCRMLATSPDTVVRPVKLVLREV